MIIFTLTMRNIKNFVPFEFSNLRDKPSIMLIQISTDDKLIECNFGFAWS